MTTTTSYGTWANHGGGGLTVADSIAEALGEFVDDYDVAAIAADYRAAIDDALPPSVSLCGDEFIGPYYAADQDFDGYPLDEFGALDIKTIAEQVDLWAIIARHDSSAEDPEFTFEIQAGNGDGTIWQALAPAETFAAADYGTLADYTSGAPIRSATRREWLTSLRAGETGAFDLNGRTVYVGGGPENEQDDPEAGTTWTAEAVAQFVDHNQTIVDEHDTGWWRICVWTGADADTGTEPAYILDHPTEKG